jgi:hypothetical protein
LESPISTFPFKLDVPETVKAVKVPTVLIVEAIFPVVTIVPPASGNFTFAS